MCSGNSMGNNISVIGIYCARSNSSVKVPAWLFMNVWDIYRAGGTGEDCIVIWPELISKSASQDIIGSTVNTSFSSFGEYIVSEAVRHNGELLIAMDNRPKEELCICVNTGCVQLVDNCNESLIGAHELRELVLAAGGLDNVVCDGKQYWMPVPEYITYCADCMMKFFLGSSVFINSIKSWEWVDSKENTLFWDVKTDAEQEWIKSRGGIIIEILLNNQSVCGYSKINPHPDLVLDLRAGVRDATPYIECIQKIYNK